MEWLSGVWWEGVFRLDTPLAEIFVRGSVMYLGLFLMLRLILKRQAGTVGISDLLVMVLIADAAQNGMAGDYRSVPDGLLLVATLIFWNFSLDWLGYRYPRIQRLVHPSPLLLVENGRLMRRNMQRELITKEELMSQMREQGVDALEKVKTAFMEGDGKITIIPLQEKGEKKKESGLV